MNLKSFNAKIAVVALALAATGYAAPAGAGDRGYEGEPHFQQAGQYDRGHWRGQWRDQGRDYRRGPGDRDFRGRFPGCEPHRALRKASWMGLRRPDIRHINHRVIVVSGSNRGHRAEIVFARRSPRCEVVHSRGIW